jgi:hypothetical protein
MVSFSLRLRISYLLLQDSSLVSFHLIQFAPIALAENRSMTRGNCYMLEPTHYFFASHELCGVCHER